MRTENIEGKAKILVVENDPVHSNSMRTVLKKAGYAVSLAPIGPQLLQVAGRHGPDLILMDSMSPVAACVDICSRLKKSPDVRNVPVILLTAGSDEPALQEAFDAGASDFIRKPVSRIELLTRIRWVLKRQQAFDKPAEQEKLRNALAATAAACHELNQPLQYVMGAVQLLLMDLPPDDPNFEQLDAIRARAEQMGAITRRLAELTNCRTGAHTEGAKPPVRRLLAQGF
jgi:DNA-binding response OmpR family regulator